MTDFDSIAVYAYLTDTWTDITSSVLDRRLAARWGIYGYSHNDIIADVGDLRFTLNNSTGQFYPDGGSPLTGWGANVKVKVIFTYGGIPYTRFLGYVPRDGLRLKLGTIAAESRVDVTALDWMRFAGETPIVSPGVLESVTADQALAVLMDYMPIKASMDFDTGDNTFPTVFDGINREITAYTEFNKIALSESPGYIYLIKQRDSGQVLVFEKSTARATPTQKSTNTLTRVNWQKHSGGGYWKWHTDNSIAKHNYTETDTTAVTFSSGLDAAALDYGGNIINYSTVSAIPRRVDDETQVLYSLPYPIPITNGETKTLKARYVDPRGGGTKVNAIVASMIQPDPPGAADPTLKCLINFNSDPIVDDTGRHSITQNDVEQRNQTYEDGYGTMMIPGGVYGGFGVFGGYSNYALEMASSSDFELGGTTDRWSIGWYANLLNPTAGNNMITRDASTSYPPYLLGVPNGTNSELRIYMSGNGTSWSIASGKTFGPVVPNRWVYYELCHDSDGWFYAFANGELTDSWRSTTAFPANTGTFTIGKSQGSSYGYFGMDMFFIRKGVCLHRANFDPPRRAISATLDGDYLLNTADDGSGTDLSDNLQIAVEYAADSANYVTLKNNSGSDGYLIHLQARGRGVYLYDPIEETVKDATSIAANGYQTLNISQPYQQTLDAGLTWIDSIVTAEKDAKTTLRSVSFFANSSATNMLRFLQCDVGDLVRVTLTAPGIDGYYHIQNVGYEVRPGNIVYVTWGLIEGNTP